ncbi:hypothetical protein [Paenibacillus sp. DMB5]|nr:hypothetical protein [Paenibacillus sp. DMB5]
MNRFEEKALVKFVEESGCEIEEVRIFMKNFGEYEKPDLRVVEFKVEQD